MNANQLAKVEKEVTEKIGKEIGTVYGECTVVSIHVAKDSKKHVVLTGDEEFVIPIEDWYDLLA